MSAHALYKMCSEGVRVWLCWCRWIGRAKEGQLPVFHEPALLAHPLMQNKSRLVVRAAGEQLPNLPTSLEQPMPSPKGGSCLDQWSGCELSVPGNQTLTELTHVLKVSTTERFKHGIGAHIVLGGCC